MFAIGSSGLTLAFIHHWRKIGLIPREFTTPPAGAVDRIVVVSGSCSPVTEGQILWAMANGFAAFRIHTAESMDALLQQSLAALAAGTSVVLYTALGPRDCDGVAGGEDVGRRLGLLLRELLVRS